MAGWWTPSANCFCSTAKADSHPLSSGGRNSTHWRLFQLKCALFLSSCPSPSGFTIPFEPRVIFVSAATCVFILPISALRATACVSPPVPSVYLLLAFSASPILIFIFTVAAVFAFLVDLVFCVKFLPFVAVPLTPFAFECQLPSSFGLLTTFSFFALTRLSSSYPLIPVASYLLRPSSTQPPLPSSLTHSLQFSF